MIAAATKQHVGYVNATNTGRLAWFVDCDCGSVTATAMTQERAEGFHRFHVAEALAKEEALRCSA